MRIRTLIVDDERIARDGVRTLLDSEPDIDVIGECGDGRSAVAAIARDAPDLVLLDIQMPVMDGFDVIRAVGEDKLPVVIFLTAYDQHALKAFDAHALDYLVKPFADARFRKAIARARTDVQQRRLGAASSRLVSVIADLLGDDDSAARPSQHRYLARIPVRSVGRTAYVRVPDVVWVGAADYYAELHTRDGKTHLVRETMQHLEERLDPAEFTRVHRSAIVRIDHIAEIRTDSADRHVVVLRDGTRLPLGRNRREALEAILADK